MRYVVSATNDDGRKTYSSVTDPVTAQEEARFFKRQGWTDVEVTVKRRDEYGRYPDGFGGVPGMEVEVVPADEGSET